MSSFLPAKNPTAYLGITDRTPGETYHKRRDPLPTDIHYNVGDRWVNINSLNFWVLGRVVSNVASWIPCGGGTLMVSQLLTDDGNLVSPTGGVIAVSGDSAQGVSTLNPAPSVVQITAQDAATGAKGVVEANTVVHGVLFGGTTQEVINSSTAGTAGQILQSQGAASDPTWTTATYPATTGAGEVLLSNAANTVISSNSLTGNFTYTDATAADTRTLTVENTDNTNAASSAIMLVQTGGATAGDPKYQSKIGAVTTWSWGADNSDVDSFVLSQNAALGTNNVFRSNVDGILTEPLQSGFSAYVSAPIATVTGDGTDYTPIIFDTELYDTQGEYAVGTGIFTAKEPGVYLFTASLNLTGVAAGHTSGNITLHISAGLGLQLHMNPSTMMDSSNQVSPSYSTIVKMIAGDTAYVGVNVTGAAKSVGIDAASYFSNFRGAKIA